MGRARYRPIDDRAHYWATVFFWTRFGKLNLEKIFREKKKKKNIVGIRRTHAHSFDWPVQLPLAQRDTAAEFCLNHSFITQLFLAFPVS